MSTKSELKYIPGLDSLRGLACLSVLLFHGNFITKHNSPGIPFKGGYLGVDLFFVLSGFLITTILVGQYKRDSTINFKNFYIKRILRLYPPILISVICFLIPLLFTHRLDAIANIVSLMTYTGDCFMLVQHFTHLPYALLSGHSWSLAIEEQFYLTFPFLLFLLLRFYSRKKQGNFISFFPIFLLLYFLIVIGFSILLGNWFYKFFFWRFFEMYLGAFIALIYSEDYGRVNKETPFSNRIKNIVRGIYGSRIALLVSIISIVWLIVYPYTFPLYNYIINYSLHYILFTVASSILIINLVYPRKSLYTRILSNNILVSIGKISYGLYLYTPFISHEIGSIFFDGNPFRSAKMMITSDVITISISLLFSYLSYTLIEKNILKLKSRFVASPERRSQELGLRV